MSNRPSIDRWKAEQNCALCQDSLAKHPRSVMWHPQGERINTSTKIDKFFLIKDKCMPLCHRCYRQIQARLDYIPWHIYNLLDRGEIIEAAKMIRDIIDAYPSRANIKSVKTALICKVCGWDGTEYPETIDYHHIGEKKYRFGIISRSNHTLARAEATKCQPVCCNCHHLIHAGLLII